MIDRQRSDSTIRRRLGRLRGPEAEAAAAEDDDRLRPQAAETAASVLPLVILPMVVLGGILLPLPELPWPAVYLADAMPSRCAFEGLFVPEADARATIELPGPLTAGEPEGPRVEDLAEGWFPRVGWRSGGGTANGMLAGTWLIGVIALVRLLRAEARRG